MAAADETPCVYGRMVGFVWHGCQREPTHEITVNGVPRRILCETHHWLVSNDRDNYDVHPHVVKQRGTT